MKILFLSNNSISLPLFTWLKNQSYEMFYCEEKISFNFIEKENFDFVISYNYKHIIPAHITDFLTGKLINLHTSLLPWNKGASPNIWVFIENTPSGVTIHLIDSGLDTGPILAQKKLEFNYDVDTLKSSYERSHKEIQKLFMDIWPAILSETIKPEKQTGEGTYHTTKDLLNIAPNINYNDTISTFLSKLSKN